MNDFQNQLDKEVQKREHEGENDPLSAETQEKRTPKKSKFSFGAFIKTFILLLLILTGVGVWAWLKTDETQAAIAEKLASKTAIVERNDSEIYRLSDAQPVLTMPAEDVIVPKTEIKVDLPTPRAPEEQDQTSQASDSASTSTAQQTSLVAAPIPGLYESVASGLLPITRKEDGLNPFEGYKRPFQKNGDKPLISFIVTDLGLSRSATEALIQNLPSEISLAFSSYARDLPVLTGAARKGGHEVWLTLPLETRDYPLHDPGPSTLLINASMEQNKDRLYSVLASTQGYAGFISEKDHVFKREDAEVNPAIEDIFKRGLAVIDSNVSTRNFVGTIASRRDYPHAKAHFWLDNDLTPLSMNQKIRQAIEFGKASGGVIIMLKPYPASIKALQKFLNSAPAKNFQLAPASAQVKYGDG